MTYFLDVLKYSTQCSCNSAAMAVQSLELRILHKTSKEVAVKYTF